MLLSELLDKAKIEYDGADCEVSCVICDSRKACDGTLFVCITGFASDGHAYAMRAYDLGCRAFVVEKDVDLPADAVVIKQENTRISLAKLSAAYYGFPAEKLKIVGITGTKGKTTTALMLASIANQNGISAGYIGSNGIDFAGNHFETGNTTPESIDLHSYFAKMADAGVEVVFVEVSSQALYLDRVFGIPFFATAFTNLAPDHIGGVEHPDFEHYKASKKKLFCSYTSTFSVYNAEDEASDYMLCGCRSLLCSFGIDKGDFHASDIQPFMENGVLGVSFIAHALSAKAKVMLPMPGRFSIANAMCAIAVAHRLDIPLDGCVKALENTFAEGRFEIVKTPLDAVFVIDYAHNGFSLTSALETLRSYSPNCLWCVVGSVGGRTKGRRAELGEAASQLADRVVLTADNPDFEDVTAICNEMRAAFVRDIPCEIIPDREEAIDYVIRNAEKGDIVLLAGKGHEQYQLVCGGKEPFSERRIIEKYAAEMSAELV
ncbi:MAG: UDP-N-acetylmuramoyl-L-alanyl-D-glutamate--2,6-diaminopimelate ligase [Clostridia bacterium]|nr:UDP-N-acetylmuramoyl-L-alanyl-D-glutamate--2,6-diaminopimelate ligase [Clostridia bacterium]